uniref:Uncharacterized protein n=1 Tax=viral metagenome TaxID=1070528 RepID=A0A6M3IPB3_9ZZZZ
MAKQVNKVEIKIEAERDGTNVNIKETATIFVTADEYPEFEAKKGIEIELTPAQETAIINHIKTIVLPQADATK